MMNPDYTGKDYVLYRVQEGNLPENTYMLSSETSKKILYNPQTAGKTLQERMEKLSTRFMDAATQKALKGTKLGDLVEFVLLAGGLYYFLETGFRKVNDHALPECFLGIKRQRVEGAGGKFTAVATYGNFESLPKNATVIIGDTIATGATIVQAMAELEKAAAESGAKINKLVICSLACSLEGGRKLKEMEQRMKAANPVFSLHLFVAEQFFHLMPDGTDLRFFGDDALMPEEAKAYTLETYGGFLAANMKCAVFDWGTRCKNPAKHYVEFLEFAAEITKDKRLDAKGKKEIARMSAEARKEMKKMERVL